VPLIVVSVLTRDHTTLLLQPILNEKETKCENNVTNFKTV
jgi:hypothetical protein